MVYLHLHVSARADICFEIFPFSYADGNHLMLVLLCGGRAATYAVSSRGSEAIGSSH
jgi:hypothetical protein